MYINENLKKLKDRWVIQIIVFQVANKDIISLEVPYEIYKEETINSCLQLAINLRYEIIEIKYDESNKSYSLKIKI